MSRMRVGTWVHEYMGTWVHEYKSRFDLKCIHVPTGYINTRLAVLSNAANHTLTDRGATDA